MSVLTSWLASPPLDAAVEISRETVSIAIVGARRDGPVVRGYAVEPLPAGAVVPGLTASNVADPAAVTEALASACRSVGVTPARAALLMPDIAARVSILRFEEVPPRREDLEQLISWQIRKSTPFPIDEACVTFSPGARDQEGTEFVVVVARRDVVREYETTCETVGIHPGLVELSTFGLLTPFMDTSPPASEDRLVVHIRGDYASMAILRGDDLIFFRSRAEGDAEALEDVVHQTAMYYQDRLKGKSFARVLLGGKGRSRDELDQARLNLERHMGQRVETLDLPADVSVSDRIHLTAELRATLAPLAGIVLRTQRDPVTA